MSSLKTFFAVLIVALVATVGIAFAYRQLAPAPGLPPRPPLGRPDVLATAPANGTEVPGNSSGTTSLSRPANPQIGLNFIRFYLGSSTVPSAADRSKNILDTTTPFVQPEAIFADFRTLGVQAYRQLVKADFGWDSIEPTEGQWNFTAPDAVIKNAEFEPIVTLFSMQYASPTPPWVTDKAQFQKTFGPEAQAYVAKVVERYGPYVKYWEIGNEMDHWTAADPGAKIPAGMTVHIPTNVPADGFSAEAQGKFLADVASFIRARDADAVIVLPGIGGPESRVLDGWFAGVLKGGGKDWFDVVNYHYYGSWQRFEAARAGLATFLKANGISDKPVWLTETGSTSSPTLTMRTNYPNSETTQAADIFRRIIPAYAAGDSLALWHTYVDSPDVPSNDWRLYGIKSDLGKNHLSFGSFQLLTTELISFSTVTSVGTSTARAYEIATAAGATKYVAWGTGSYAVPTGMTQKASVVPDSSGTIAWTTTAAGQTIALTDVPVILK